MPYKTQKGSIHAEAQGRLFERRVLSRVQLQLYMPVSFTKSLKHNEALEVSNVVGTSSCRGEAGGGRLLDSQGTGQAVVRMLPSCGH